jgi:hypothetical protein|nr:MAG TPA: hypothetical protein [Caudoviricetes sp.]
MKEVLEQLENLKISSKPGYRIYLNEELLVMNSGKFVWAKKGEAKNALIGSLKYTLGYREYYELKTYDVLEKLIEEGTIKIEYYDGETT